MFSLKTSIFILLFVLLSLTHVSSKTIVELSKCEEQNLCSHRGYCQYDRSKNTTECNCAKGYYTFDCSKSIKDLRPAAWYTVRVVFTVVYFILAATAIFALVYTAKASENYSSNAFSFFNMRKIALGLLAIITMLNFLFYAIDPGSFEKITPYGVTTMFLNLPFPLTLILFGCIILHWFEVYRQTVTTLRQEEMKKRINSNYQANVTLESILEKLSLFNRVKIAFFVFNIAFLGIDIAYIVVLSKLDTGNLHSTNPLRLETAFYAIFLILYIGEAIGFLIFGRRLVKLMPQPLSHKMQRVTRRLQILSWVLVSAVIILVPIYLVTSNSVDVFLWVVWVISECVFIAIFSTMISLFVNKTSSFPYCFSFSLTRSTHSRTSAKTVESQNIETLEVVEAHQEENV